MNRATDTGEQSAEVIPITSRPPRTPRGGQRPSTGLCGICNRPAGPDPACPACAEVLR